MKIKLTYTEAEHSTYYKQEYRRKVKLHRLRETFTVSLGLFFCAWAQPPAHLLCRLFLAVNVSLYLCGSPQRYKYAYGSGKAGKEPLYGKY